MSQENVGPPEGRHAPPLDEFRKAYLVSIEAFNRHDFDAAFLGFDEGIEWQTVADVPGPRVMQGRESVIEGFRGLLAEFPDWHVEPQDFIPGGEDAILVCNIGTATGRQSGVPISQPFTQVWTFREGRPIRIREYFDHGEALEAVGLRE